MRKGISRIFRPALVLACVLSFGICRAQTLKVQNVRFEEKGEEVIITYDLEGKEDHTYFVTLSLSADQGRNFRLEPRAVSGDVGGKIVPGRDKKITWKVKEDFPYGLVGDGFVFAVDAEYRNPPSRIPYYAAGACITGGILYLMLRGEPKSNLVIRIPAEF